MHGMLFYFCYFFLVASQSKEHSVCIYVRCLERWLPAAKLLHCDPVRSYKLHKVRNVEENKEPPPEAADSCAEKIIAFHVSLGFGFGSVPVLCCKSGRNCWGLLEEVVVLSFG